MGGKTPRKPEKKKPKAEKKPVGLQTSLNPAHKPK
jgi:hypothetical protein